MIQVADSSTHKTFISSALKEFIHKCVVLTSEAFEIICAEVGITVHSKVLHSILRLQANM